MRFLPKTRADWGRFVLLPFKLFVLTAWPTLRVLATGVGLQFDADMVIIFMELYALCFVALMIGGVEQRSRGFGFESVVTFAFALLALLVALPFRIL